MTLMEASPRKSVAAWLSSPFSWLATGLGFLACALILTWGALAIYWSNLPWAWSRLVLALAFAAFGAWALWRSRNARARLAFAGLFVAVLAWWLLIPPSNDRDWRKEVTVVPRAVIDGDRVRISGVRNFDYRSRDDFTVRHEEREVLALTPDRRGLLRLYWMQGRSGTPS